MVSNSELCDGAFFNGYKGEQGISFETTGDKEGNNQEGPVLP